MNEKLHEAMSLYKKGRKEQAQEIFAEIVKKDSKNSVAWYGLAMCLSNKNEKIYCLQRTLALDPSNQQAKQLLESLETKRELPGDAQPEKTKNLGPEQPLEKTATIKKSSTMITLSVVGIVIIIILLLTRKEPYQPNANDAFSRAAGYALRGMYARDPANYWCTETESKQADYWYEIKVSELGNGRYSVIGATKAIDQSCVYEIGYFAATVRYDQESELWNLEGDVYISNPCLTVESYGSSNRSTCTVWKYDWQPDMNWRPPQN